MDAHSDIQHTVLWKRLDLPGMDACALRHRRDGFELAGTAMYQSGPDPSRLSYQVLCAADWTTRRAEISGWVGRKDFHLSVERNPNGQWSLNQEPLAGFDTCLDLDLGFTPATNTNAIRRLKLDVGATAETTALWLDTSDWTFKALRQVYRRLSEYRYGYASPANNFAAELDVDDAGFVLTYPDLWSAIT